MINSLPLVRSVMSLRRSSNPVATAHRASLACRLVVAAGALVALTAVSVPAAMADVQPMAAMLRNPAISQSQVAFTYANKLWIAPKAGGVASPLASPPGSVGFSRFSPDGQSVVFVGNYDGGRDIYTLPVSGGIPTRVTHHPANESISQWTTDGRIVFMASGIVGAGLTRQTQLYSVPVTGGMPTKFPMPYSGFGSLNADGSMVAFTPHSTDNRTWKRYRGGMATDIWVMNLKDNSAKQITDWEGTDTIPMWGSNAAKNTIYYLSDNGKDHRLNIWSYDTTSGTRAQVTSFSEDDVRWPSIGPGAPGSKGEIVFQLGSRLMLLNLDTAQSSEIKITIPGARPTIRAQVEDVSGSISDAGISPTGKRVVVEARGDIWTAPAKEGIIRNLTSTDNVFDRDPSWSPDGKWIAYFSDASGEYELWVRASDAKAPTPPEPEKKDDDKSDKKDDKKSDDAKKDEAPKDEAAKDKPAGEATDSAKKEEPSPAPAAKAFKLTEMGPGFRYSPTWSPDSKHIAFTDKAGAIMLATLKVDETTGAVTAELKTIDTDPWANQPALSWSHDSAWLAYDRADEGNQNEAVWVYNIKAAKNTRLTSPMFSSGSPAFDRKGEYLYYRSARNFGSPTYADNDTTFAYVTTHQLLAAPLRAEMKNPFDVKLDEEELKAEKKKPADKKDEKKDDKGEPKKDAAPKPADSKDEPKKDDTKKDAAALTVEQSVWSLTATGGTLPPEGLPFQLTVRVKADSSVTAKAMSALGAVEFNGTIDKATGKLSLSGSVGPNGVTIAATIEGTGLSGTWTSGEINGTIKGDRTSVEMVADEPAKDEPKKDEPKKEEAKKDEAKKDDAKKDDAKKDDAKKDDDKKEIKIDFDGFEQRAILLPIGSGNFGNLSVSNDNKLLYIRSSGRTGGEGPSIRIFDINEETREEKTVLAGAGGFTLSADGKKILVRRGGGLVIHDAAAGGGKAQIPFTSSMRTLVRPREQWKQLVTDAWRLQRDFFYEPTMHGVNWANVKTHYLGMLEDASSREDVNFIISEMISELNVGHAYLQGTGDVEGPGPQISVGLLGADFVLDKVGENAAYKITAIYQGGDHDADARGPLSRPGLKKNRINVGDYLLAVNGTPIDTSKDIFASFIGTGERTTVLTVNTSPVIDSNAREVTVRPTGVDSGLRYRAWIEKNRKYVDEKSGGKVGYIYVPNTGVDGQNDLFRQFAGQRDRDALIIDERWNGGGQIPTRFIEMLNRPVTNYWARRDGKDWVWPPDGHQGHKVMLINGLAGSGGDMFPWLFKHNKLGKLIGTRTWGGLVGITANPPLIDGGSISVPSFGFYEKDGTWGIEGHGTDPDIVVIDDPSKMVSGGDPQLDAAIDLMLKEIAASPITQPKRPASPNRSGLGIAPEDK
ncbi:MAG: PDZ domain-containing protein [Phycisphaerales bacterium]|nr:PDZ domain-containing protein [Phycisphaerales bacterium]